MSDPNSTPSHQINCHHSGSGGDDEGEGAIDVIKASVIKGWLTFWTVIESIGLIACLFIQGAILDYYILYYEGGSPGWYFLLLIDFIVLILFATAIILAKKHYSSWTKSTESDTDPGRRLDFKLFYIHFPSFLGVLPMSYISWLVYTLVLTVKILIFFIRDIPTKMNSPGDTSPNGIKLFELAVASTAVVFLLWIEAHKNLEDEIHRQWSKALTNELIGHTTFEIFDTIFFLELIIPDNDLVLNKTPPPVSTFVKYTIIVLGSLNLVYPSLGLFRLAKLHKHSQKEETQTRLNPESHIYGASLLVHLIRLTNVNLPYLLIRIHLASSYDRQLSIFIIKNALGILTSLRSITMEYYLWKSTFRLRPKNTRRAPKIRIMEQPVETSNKPRTGWELTDMSTRAPSKDNSDIEINDVSSERLHI